MQVIKNAHRLDGVAGCHAAIVDLYQVIAVPGLAAG